jgi:superfamily II DNA or RNA helicase
MEPLRFKTFKGYASDVPFVHPASLTHHVLHGIAGKGRNTELFASLPRLATYFPVPLPGLITAWDLTQFKSRIHSNAIYRMAAVGLELKSSLHSLRRLLHDWGQRYGSAFLPPQASVVIELLDFVRKRVSEGPLLPTVTLPDNAWTAPISAAGSPLRNEGARAAWVPPVTLQEVNALWSSLRASVRLAASTEYDYGYNYRRGTPSREHVPTWIDEASPARFATFLTELFVCEVERVATKSPRVLVLDAFREKRAREDTLAVHRDHGSCLFPDHPVLSPPSAPNGHLHARLHPAATKGAPWNLELGITDDKHFTALSTLQERGVLRDALVADGASVWFRPNAVLARDWPIAARAYGSVLRAPEILRDGRMQVSEAEAIAMLEAPPLKGEGYEYLRWLEEIQAPGNVRSAKVFTAFTCKAANEGAAHVRVRWQTSLGEADGSLHTARFTPVLHVAVGDAELLAADAEKLIREATASFVSVHGRVVPREAIEQALDLLRAREKVLARLGDGKGFTWARTVELEDEWSSDRNAIATETIFASRWEEFLTRLRDGAGVPPRVAPEGFKGTLRPYQERGLSWLSFLVENGFGACLADDMGLGKTIQVLALLASRDRKRAAGPDLVVCPTAVVLNWQRESKRFTPSLRVYVHQGTERMLGAEAFAKRIKEVDLVVTSFALIRRDRDCFEACAWGLVVIDEAQNLKNPDALQTRAVGVLRSESRVALTGTPVENHLRDLWSIYHVVTPGLFGGSTRFAKTFLSPIRQGDTRALDKLTRRVGPFLLRRTKGDPGIADDLPPRQEQETFCDLTREQVALYQAMTEATVEGVIDKKGIERRAHILAALTRFKQICNHPENFHIEKPHKLFGRSGKLDRMIDLLEELIESKQRTVIFTQFTEMGNIIVRAISERFDCDVDFYHGGLKPSEREEVLTAFNDPEGPPALVVSLKAGGSGLNLQVASAVIHYDRWWNPAVEDQATGRAHRLGQTRGVNVYKFVTRGTLEERIVTMLESKRELAERVLGASDESWITEMDDRALQRFLSLDAVTEERDDEQA